MNYKELINIIGDGAPPAFLSLSTTGLSPEKGATLLAIHYKVEGQPDQTLYVKGGDPSIGREFHRVNDDVYYRDAVSPAEAAIQLGVWAASHTLFSYNLKFTHKFLDKLYEGGHFEPPVLHDLAQLYTQASSYLPFPDANAFNWGYIEEQWAMRKCSKVPGIKNLILSACPSWTADGAAPSGVYMVRGLERLLLVLGEIQVNQMGSAVHETHESPAFSGLPPPPLPVLG